MGTGAAPDEATDGILCGGVKTWRDEVIGRLDGGADHLTVAADPDELLLEERVLQRIEALGYDLITFDDHVAFRFRDWPRSRIVPDREAFFAFL